MRHPDTAGARKRPIAGRLLASPLALLLVPLALVGSALGQTPPPEAPLTEEEAVRRALARPGLTEQEEGEVGVVRSEAVGARILPEPEISLEREQTFGGPGAAQDTLVVSQRIDLSGRRSLRVEAAEHRERAVRKRWAGHRLQLAAQARTRFHRLLAAQQGIGTTERWVERIRAALGIVTQREAAGDASAYERRRLERELSKATSRLAARRADAEGAWGSLGALISSDAAPLGPPPPAQGTLLPPPPQPLAQLLSSLGARPDLAALHAEAAAAETDGRAAERRRLPEPELTLGWTGISAGDERADGYVAGVSLNLPLFDQGQEGATRAAGEARAARARLALALNEARAELYGRAAALGQLVGAASVFRREAATSAAALIPAAEAGYGGDELGVLELLDAYRGAYEDELEAIALDLAARRAHIELTLLTGSKIQ